MLLVLAYLEEGFGDVFSRCHREREPAACKQDLCDRGFRMRKWIKDLSIPQRLLVKNIHNREGVN